MKKIGVVIFFLLSVIRLTALSVYITNDNADMVNGKKICIRLSFDPGEAAIYKDTLCLSVDTPELELKGWRTTAQAPVIYVANFKKNSRLFTESFNLEILIDFASKEKQKQIKALQESYLSISLLMLTKSGENRAVNVMTPLKALDIAVDFSLATTSTTLPLYSEYTSTLLPYQRSFEFFNRTKRFVGKQDVNEVLVIDRTKDLGAVLRQQVFALFSLFPFYKVYGVFWVLWLLLIFCLFYPSAHFVALLSRRLYGELFALINVFLITSSWWLLRAYIAPHVWYGIMCAFCVPGSCYYLWGGTKTFLGRIKVLIGIIFAVAFLPLLALAYMHNNFDLLLK